MMPRAVDILALDIHRLEGLIGPERSARFHAPRTRPAPASETGRSSTSTRRRRAVASQSSCRPCSRTPAGVGIDARWLVIDGNPEFFRVTKRIHNHLYGSTGDGGALGPVERQHYETRSKRTPPSSLPSSAAGDIVLLHDPQTAGLARAFSRAGARVIWRCHVGRDQPEPCDESAWNFLRPYLEDADAFVFHRAEFAPTWIDHARLHVDHTVDRPVQQQERDAVRRRRPGHPPARGPARR